MVFLFCNAYGQNVGGNNVDRGDIGMDRELGEGSQNSESRNVRTTPEVDLSLGCSNIRVFY